LPDPEPERPAIRLDIEGLRALAVILVLAYHAEIGPFRGGFIGVDVFFVVSGFLISTLLLTELRRTGYISLRRFWARRARRLLPASTLVIVATVIAGAFVLDPLSATNLAHDALATALFVINIVLAHRQSDYLTTDAAPSPLLHFWSLALEEQFYLLWPVLLQVLAGYRRHPRAIVTGLVAVLWPLSFVACVTLTRSDQPWAFFSLPTRAWELLTGAGLALVAASIQRVPSIPRRLGRPGRHRGRRGPL
jgi:peptidoglycan/LPS O-acetylase OafA/YrhL